MADKLDFITVSINQSIQQLRMMAGKRGNAAKAIADQLAALEQPIRELRQLSEAE